MCDVSKGIEEEKNAEKREEQRQKLYERLFTNKGRFTDEQLNQARMKEEEEINILAYKLSKLYDDDRILDVFTRRATLSYAFGYDAGFEDGANKQD